jgi:hypothetical protein
VKETGLEWTVFDTPLILKEVSSISTPKTNKLKLYAKDKSSVSALYYKNDAGTEIDLSGGLTGSGTANRLAYWTGTLVLGAVSALTQGHVLFADSNGLPTGESNLFWNASDNRLGLGTAVPGFQFHGVAPDASSFNFNLDTYGTGVVANYRGRAARGTLASATALQADDLILAVSGLPYGATAFASAARAQIRFIAGENQSDTAQGTYMSLFTTALTGTTTAERFRVGPSGQWGIGGATFGGSGDIFSSGGASAAPSWVTRATLNAALDHGTLAGLTDDDHTQYALLAGRSGGQTLKGGTGSGDDLTLQSTNHATKGHVIFGTTSSYDETNNVFGAQTLDPFSITARPGFCALSDTNAVLQLRSHGTAASLALFQSARGTIASPSALQSLDDLFVFNAYGQYDTTVGHFNLGAQLSARATETFSSTAAGTRWQFSTVTNATTTLTERLRIEQDGAIHLTADAYQRFVERSTTPANPSDGVEIQAYMRANKIIYQYNDGGTVRYKYLDMTGTGVTWVHTTTAPT